MKYTAEQVEGLIDRIRKTSTQMTLDMLSAFARDLREREQAQPVSVTNALPDLDWIIRYCDIPWSDARSKYQGMRAIKHVAMKVRNALTTPAGDAFGLPQSFVDRVTSDPREEPPVLAGDPRDSIRLIAETMVTAVKASRQGDANITEDVVDEWAHRIMCFAAPTAPAGEKEHDAFDLLCETVRGTLAAAVKKFPEWPVHITDAHLIVAEEAGELAKAVNECVNEYPKSKVADIEKEALQTMAMCFRFLAALSRYDYTQRPQVMDNWFKD